jgi:hypothetical protein
MVDDQLIAQAIGEEIQVQSGPCEHNRVRLSGEMPRPAIAPRQRRCKHGEREHDC